MGNHSTWEITRRGKSHDMGNHTTWEITTPVWCDNACIFPMSKLVGLPRHTHSRMGQILGSISTCFLNLRHEISQTCEITLRHLDLRLRHLALYFFFAAARRCIRAMSSQHKQAP